MKYLRIPITLLLLVSSVFAQRIEIELEKDWKFNRGKMPSASALAFDDSEWETVDIPHDWAIYGPFDSEVDKQYVRIEQNQEKAATEKTGRTGALPFIGVGWYRKNFEVPDLMDDQKALLIFEGAMSEAQVYVNGDEVGQWPYGYSYFYFDVTKHLKEGNNLVSVRLQNREKSSRWYPGAGIYRDVILVIKNQVSFEQWGTFVTTPYVTEIGNHRVKAII